MSHSRSVIPLDWRMQADWWSASVGGKAFLDILDIIFRIEKGFRPPQDKIGRLRYSGQKSGKPIKSGNSLDYRIQDYDPKIWPGPTTNSTNNTVDALKVPESEGLEIQQAVHSGFTLSSYVNLGESLACSKLNHLGMKILTCNPNIQGLRQNENPRTANLGYIMNSRTTQAIVGDLVLKSKYPHPKKISQGLTDVSPKQIN